MKLLVDAGAMKPGPALSQKMGPLGINLGKIIADVNKATSEFKGIKVPVLLDINTKTKAFTVSVSTPPTSELLKQELGITKGSGEAKNIKMGNLPFETIIKVAKIKEKDMMVNSLNAAIDSVLGTCVSLGILVESKDGREIIKEVKEGKYNDLISKGTEEASQEKIALLAEEFAKVQKTQDAYIKSVEAKKEAKAAAAGTAAAATGAEGAAAPEEGAAAPAAAAAAKAPAKASAKEEKKVEKKKK